MTGTLSPNIPTIGLNNSVADPEIRESFITLRDGLNAILNAENKVDSTVFTNLTTAQLKAAKLNWYTPLNIATEQTITTTTFKTMAENGAAGTADEIKEVVLAENGLLVIGFQGIWKNSVAETGKAAIFIGENQLKKAATSAVPAVQETEPVGVSGTAFGHLATSIEGLKAQNAPYTSNASLVTTGMLLGQPAGFGVCFVWAAAGTYNISIKYKSSSGQITARERHMWVATLG